MQCSNCGAELQLRREFCPQCGQRVTFSLDDVVNVAQTDAAWRHGDDLNKSLRSAIGVLVVLFAVAWSLSYYYDKRLTFDASMLPAPAANAPATGAGGGDDNLKPLTEPRPLPPVVHANPRRLGHRVEPMRGMVRAANGGAAKDFDIAIEMAQAFLGKGQERDGGWPVKLLPNKGWPLDDTQTFQWGRVGVSSLVLLSFLADGHTWNKEPNGPQSKYGLLVQNGLRFLVRSQDPGSGRIGPGEGERVHFMYNHAMATLALSEGAALTGDPDLLEHVQKAVDYAAKTQTNGGGWNYFGHKEVDDISVSAWQVQALLAAREAGANVPDETLRKALALFKRATIPGQGRVAYRLPDDDGVYTPSLAAMGLMIRQLAGESSGQADLRPLATKVVAAAPKVKIPEWTHGWKPDGKTDLARSAFDPYMLYYSTYALFFAGGAEWKEWSGSVLKSIVGMQDYDGAWHPNDPSAYKGGTYYSTALCLLCLQVHHRIHHSAALSGVQYKD